MRRARAVWMTAALAALAAFAGCATRVADREASFEPPAMAVDPAVFGGVTGPAIDVENHRGSVEIRVIPRLTRIEVRSVTLADAGATDEQEAAATAQEMTATMEDRGGLPVLVVRLPHEAGASASHANRVVIRTPACSGLRVRNAGGLVHVVGVSGAIQVENIDGHIEVRTNAPVTQPVALVTTEGNIYFQIPPASTGRFDVQSGDGRARLEAVAPGIVTGRMQASPDRAVFTLNNGDNAALVRTGKGNAIVSVIDDPEGRIRTFR